MVRGVLSEDHLCDSALSSWGSLNNSVEGQLFIIASTSMKKVIKNWSGTVEFLSNVFK